MVRRICSGVCMLTFFAQPASSVTDPDDAFYKNLRYGKVSLQVTHLLNEVAESSRFILEDVNEGLSPDSKWILDLHNMSQVAFPPKESLYKVTAVRYENSIFQHHEIFTTDSVFHRFREATKTLSMLSSVCKDETVVTTMGKVALSPVSNCVRPKRTQSRRLGSLVTFSAKYGFLLKTVLLTWKLHCRERAAREYGANNDVIETTLQLYFVAALVNTEIAGVGWYLQMVRDDMLDLSRMNSEVCTSMLQRIEKIFSPAVATVFSAFTVITDMIELTFSHDSRQQAFYATQLSFDFVAFSLQGAVLGLHMIEAEALAATLGAFVVPVLLVGAIVTAIATHAVNMQHRARSVAASIMTIANDYEPPSFQLVTDSVVELNFGTIPAENRTSTAVIKHISFRKPSSVGLVFGTPRVHKTLDWHEGGRFIPGGTASDPDKTFLLREALNFPLTSSMFDAKLRHASRIKVILPAAPDSSIDFHYGMVWGMSTLSTESYPELATVRMLQSKPYAHWYFEYFGYCEMAVTSLVVEYFHTKIVILLGSHLQYHLFVPPLQSSWNHLVTYDIHVPVTERAQENYLQVRAGILVNINHSHGGNTSAHTWEIDCTKLVRNACLPKFSRHDVLRIGSILKMFGSVESISVRLISGSSKWECQFSTQRCTQQPRLKAQTSCKACQAGNPALGEHILKKRGACLANKYNHCTHITHPSGKIEVHHEKNVRILGSIKKGSSGMRTYLFNTETRQLSILMDGVQRPISFPHAKVSIVKSRMADEGVHVTLSDGLQCILNEEYITLCHTLRVNAGNSLQDVEKHIMKIADWYVISEAVNLDIALKLWQVWYVLRTREFLILEHQTAEETYSILGSDRFEATWYFVLKTCTTFCEHSKPILYQMQGFSLNGTEPLFLQPTDLWKIKLTLPFRDVNMFGETLLSARTTGEHVVIETEENPGRLLRVTASGRHILSELDFRVLEVTEEHSVLHWCGADSIDWVVPLFGLDRMVWCFPFRDLVVSAPRADTADWIFVGFAEMNFPLVLNSQTGRLYVSSSENDTARIAQNLTVVDHGQPWYPVILPHPFLDSIAYAHLSDETSDLVLLDTRGITYLAHSNSSFLHPAGTHLTLIGVNNMWMVNNVGGIHHVTSTSKKGVELSIKLQSLVSTFRNKSRSNVTIVPILTIGSPNLGLWYHTACACIISTEPVPSANNPFNLLSQQLISYNCRTKVPLVMIPATKMIYTKNAAGLFRPILHVDSIQELPESILVIISDGETLREPLETGMDILYTCSDHKIYILVQHETHQMTMDTENETISLPWHPIRCLNSGKQKLEV